MRRRVLLGAMAASRRSVHLTMAYFAPVLHAKTFVVDGVLSSVGSSNMDWRSFTGNDEVNAFVLGRDFGAAMERMFGRDVADSRPVTLASWRERPWPGRLAERAALMFERLW